MKAVDPEMIATIAMTIIVIIVYLLCKHFLGQENKQ